MSNLWIIFLTASVVVQLGAYWRGTHGLKTEESQILSFIYFILAIIFAIKRGMKMKNTTKTTKQTYDNLHCVQCHKLLKYKVALDNSVVSICHQPACPNYGLLAMPQEQMPKENLK